MSRAAVGCSSVFLGLMLMSTVARAGTIAEVYSTFTDFYHLPYPPYFYYPVSVCEQYSTSVSGASAVSGCGHASSSFGSLAGAAGAGTTVPEQTDTGGFWAEFSDAVKVTGATGPGSLAAHFTWQVEPQNGIGDSAEVSVLLGDVREHLGFEVPGPGACGDEVPCMGKFDISTPFVFDEWTDIGALIEGYASIGGVCCSSQEVTD
ncbi:MAG: hypothetical protein ACRD3W_17955, partial [Terriglobales bacterium]